MNEKYNNLVAAISLLDVQLKSRYEIDAALVDMAAVVSAKKSAVQALDAELASRRAEIDASLEQANRDTKAAIDALKADEVRYKTGLALDRKREQEQYDYDLKRSRKVEQDAHDDRMAVLAKDIASSEARLAELIAEIDDIEALRARVASFDSDMAARFEAGVEEGKKQAGREYGFEKNMLKKDHDYELKSRDDAIKRLTSDVADKSAKIEAPEKKLDAAYGQLRDLATKTVESSGGLKVISTGSDGNGSKK